MDQRTKTARDQLTAAYAAFWAELQDAVDAQRWQCGDEDDRCYSQVMTAVDAILQVRADVRRQGLPCDQSDLREGGTYDRDEPNEEGTNR